MQQKKKLGALRRVEFIWCNRDTGSFEWFQTLLKSLEVRFGSSFVEGLEADHRLLQAQTDPDFLRISMYLTAKIDIDTMNNIAINGTPSSPLPREHR